MSTEAGPERAASPVQRRPRAKVARSLWIVAALAAAALLVMVFLAKALVWPDSGTIARADAVVVPSGDPGSRLERALELVGAGVAPTLVLVGTPDFAKVERLCRTDQAFEVVCLRPEPDSTRNEARALGELADTRQWRSIIVVTSSMHVSRAGLLFRRCFSGKVVMVRVGSIGDVAFRDAVRSLVHESAGLAYATAARQC